MRLNGSEIGLRWWAVIGLVLGLSGPGSGAEVWLPLGANFQGIINSHPAGTHFVIRAGTHRGVMIVPRSGDIISAEPGAVLNGSLELPNWRLEGQWWVHDAPLVAPEASGTGILCADMICTQPQDLYFDDERLYAVRTKAEVVDDGRWFLDRALGRIYVRRNPTGRLVEFGGPSPLAIDCTPPGLPVRQGVIIQDLVIEKYPTPLQVGAVRLGGGAVCRRCDIRQSHAYGVQLNGAARVQDCYLHDNGMDGIGGSGAGAVIEGCEIAHNVWPYFSGVAWDSAGIKIADSSETVIRRCYVHHNNGPGIWTDILSRGLLLEDNIIEFNKWEGILFELSDHMTARRNICRWNGTAHRGALWGGQICIQNSSYIELDSNYLECGPGNGSPLGSAVGVLAINQNERVWDEGVFGHAFSVRNLNIHHNTTVMPFLGNNGVDYGTLGWNSYSDFLNAGLVWHHNRYLAGHPLDLAWSWRLGPTWDATVASRLSWDFWQGYQDADGTFETFGPDAFPASGMRQAQVIWQTTGHDYASLKESMIRQPGLLPADGDGDGLPDAWEEEIFGSVGMASGTGDADGDGWTNTREFTAGSDPTRADSDGDGLTDPWEFDRGLDPLVHDSDTDADFDELTAREEFEGGTNPAVAQSLDLPVDESDLSLWLTPGAGMVTGAGGAVQSWIEHSPHRKPVGISGGAVVTGVSPTGRPLVAPGGGIVCPGRSGFWGTAASGFTMSLIFQPTAIDLTHAQRAILTNEQYGVTGFRLRLESGYLVLNAGQSGGSLHLAGHTRLQAGRTYVITVHYGGPGGRHALYLNGSIEAWGTTGLIQHGSNPLVLGQIGGVVPQPGYFGDVVVFDRALSHLERRAVERLLVRKFLAGFAPGGDADLDGMVNAYEQAHQHDPFTPDAAADDDADGASNAVEMQHGTNPHDADSDDDGSLDGWEISQGLNPLTQNDLDADGLPDVWELQFLGSLADGVNGDPDGDGWNNRREFFEGTHPLSRDTDADGLPDSWEPAHGLDPTVHDSAVDADIDGRSAREEFEDGTDPAVPQWLDQAVPEAGLSLWLETGFGLVTRPGGTVDQWISHNPHRKTIQWGGTPAVVGTSPTGRPLVDPGGYLSCPGAPGFWGTPTGGFTMSFFFQPASIDSSGSWRAVLSNETYLQSGFRLRLVGGRLVWSAGQSGGTLEVAGPTKLEAGRLYLITLHYGGPGGRHALYLDGNFEAAMATGVIHPSANPLMLGNTSGSTPQPGRFGDVVVFGRSLSHFERRTVERMMWRKFHTGMLPGPDSDLDGLADAYEQAHQLDPLTPDALADPDQDGATNLREAQQGTNPHDADTDNDGLTDGWELDHWLNPLVQNDDDNDGLPDVWENQFFSVLTHHGVGDPDGDGWTNAREFAEGTNPASRDTDADGIADSIEAGLGLNPRVNDSNSDADFDSRSAREEFEDGTDPLVAQALDQPVSELSVQCWLETVVGLAKRTDGRVNSWVERSRHRRTMALSGAPAVSGASPAGRPLVFAGHYVACPGDAGFWGTAESGFTMSFVFRPGSIDPSGAWWAILSNETYLQNGFRVRLVGGHLVWSAGISGGTVELTGPPKLEAGRTYLISLHYAPPGGRHAMYIDGVEVASTTGGIIRPSPNVLMIGNTVGSTPQPATFGDVVVFDRALTHRERRTVERLLREKFQTGVPAGADRDRDGMLDAHETAHGMDPLTPDAWGDEDRDGALNITEFLQGTNPRVPHASQAGWANGFGLTGANAQPNADPDRDGLPNAVEYITGGHPAAAEAQGRPAGTIAGGSFVFTFQRADASETPDVSLDVDVGPTPGNWTTTYRVGNNTLASSAGVTVIENGPSPDTIVVTIPRAARPVQFARVRVTVWP